MSALRPLSGAKRHQPPITYYRFANGFAMARAQSMNACANGLRVRPCRVMTPIGRGGTGDSSGNALSGRVSVNCNIDTGSKMTKRPRARIQWCHGIEKETTLALEGCITPQF